MKAIYTVFLLFSVIFLTLPVQAQTGNSPLEREMILEREYNPSLRDANKMNQLPEIKEPEAPKTQVEFSNFLLDYYIPPYLSNLRAQSYFSDYATSNKKGYLNLGASSLLDIDGDLGYQILNTDKDYLSIDLSHRSSNSDITPLQNERKRKMKINDNWGGINYSHDFEKVKLLADAQYIYSGFNYYGINWLAGEADGVSQVNNILKARLGLHSLDSEDLSYKINLHTILFKQKESSDNVRLYPDRTENIFGGDFDIHTFANSSVGFGLGGAVDYSKYDLGYFPSIKCNYTVFSINPYAFFEGANWDIRLGVSAFMQTQTQTKDRYIFAPDVKINWMPSDQFLIYAQATGGVEDNNSYHAFLENRYINPRFLRLQDNRVPLDATLGTRFSLMPELSIDMFAGYKISKDEHFIVFDVGSALYRLPDSGIDDGSIEAPRYEDIPVNGLLSPFYNDAQTFRVGGAVNYAYQDIFDFRLQMAYDKWMVEDLYGELSLPDNEAWGKPQFISDAQIGFRVPSLPLRVDLNYHLEAGRKALLYRSGSAESMKDIHSLNATVLYSINDSFSVFARANNLLLQEYDLWYGYPAQNFNIMGGLSVKF